jgi:hypothetical protein
MRLVEIHAYGEVRQGNLTDFLRVLSMDETVFRKDHLVSRYLL